MTATVQNAGSKSSQNRDKRLRHSGILKAVSFNERKNLHQLYASIPSITTTSSAENSVAVIPYF